MVVRNRKHFSQILAGAWGLVVVSIVSGQQYKHVPPERSIGGVSAEDYIAARDQLHAILTREIPEGIQNTRVGIKLTDDELAVLQRRVPAAGEPLRIGTVKSLSPALSVSGIVVPEGHVELGVPAAGGTLRLMDDGGFTWAVSVGSEGANGLRIHFKNFSMPDGAKMYFLNQEGEAYGPYTGRGRHGTGEFWTDSIYSDTGVIMLRFKGPPSPDDMDGISFVIDSVGHIGFGFEPSPEGGAASGGVCGNASCIVDANCVNVAPAEQTAIAKMEWVDPPFIFTCTGGLIADTDPGTQRNLFLTANHCLSSEAVAGNVETFFVYTTASCDGSCPGNPAPHTIGSTILDTSDFGDHTLLELSQNPPPGSTFLGWTNEPIANTSNADLFRVSNPGFGPQVYSHHRVTTTAGTCGILPRGEFIYSKDITGATDGGSSGSPVVNSLGQVVGQLFGCCGSNCSNVCNSSANSTIDGALAAYFFMVEEFLDPPESGTCRLDELTASDAAEDDRFAFALAIDGDVIVSGTPFTDDTFADTGSAYVYRFDGDGWPEEAKLTATDPISGDQFGNSVGVSGDVAVIGAHRVDDGGGNSGAAYVWRYNGATWDEEQKLTASDADTNAFFGSSVDVDGDLAVVGAFIAKCPDSSLNCGAAYVYRFDGVVWDEEQILVASDWASGDVFGISVAMDGDLLVVGAQNAGCGTDLCGAAYVFRHDGFEWVEEAKLTASDASHLDLYGGAVALEGDRIVVGARGDDCVDASADCGAAYVYRQNDANWDEEVKLLAWDPATDDEFGGAVAVSEGVIVVGARDQGCNEGDTSCGTAYVFQFNGDEWVGDLRLRPLDRGADDQFGQALALDAPLVVVGASKEDCGIPDDCGKAYVFAVAGDCNHNGADDVCDINSGFSLDCNTNGIPDECDPDCNENGIPDTCDINSGFSEDCNENGISDECETDCNENGIPDSCDIASGFSEDLNQNGVPDECCILAGAAVEDSQGIKNRYLSFSLGDIGRLQAIRVTFVDLPSPFEGWNGAQLWVGPTTEVSENGSSVEPLPGFGTFLAATLECDPLYVDWSQLGDVHVFHEGIIPRGSYRIQVLDETCQSSFEDDYSAPLDILNPKWGDTVTDLSTDPPGPPDDLNGIIDALAIIQAFGSAPGAISKARADLDPCCQDLLINITDVLGGVSGFQGLPYACAPSAAAPCDTACGSPFPN